MTGLKRKMALLLAVVAAASAYSWYSYGQLGQSEQPTRPPASTQAPPKEGGATLGVRPTASAGEMCGAVSSVELDLALDGVGGRLNPGFYGVVRWAKKPSIWIANELSKPYDLLSRIDALYGAAGFSAPSFLQVPTKADIRVYAFTSEPASMAQRGKSVLCGGACLPNGGGRSPKYAFAFAGSPAVLALRGEHRQSDEALLYFKRPYRRADQAFAVNADGTLIANSAGRFEMSECFVNISLPEEEQHVLLQECLVRTFGFTGHPESNGPELLRVRTDARRLPVVTEQAWSAALDCVRQAYR